MFAAQSWVTGPELLAPAMVSRHKVRKCIGQGSWEGQGAGSLRSGRRTLSTPWVVNLQEAQSEVQSLLHLGRKGLQSPESEALSLQPR